jgi:hypothetical protein
MRHEPHTENDVVIPSGRISGSNLAPGKLGFNGVQQFFANIHTCTMPHMLHGVQPPKFS